MDNNEDGVWDSFIKEGLNLNKYIVCSLTNTSKTYSLEFAV